tara:strand:+ start:807 stop:1529 length:723 start_codon:yes stop_codon:yes gene_type:complete
MKLFKSEKVYLFNYKKNSFFEGFYRLLAIIVSPLLKNLNPNFISVLSLLSGITALFLSSLYDVNLKIIILFFLISFIFDFADGLIARLKKQTSFYGRFIDGLFDILVIGFLHIIFINYIKANHEIFFNINIYYTILLLLPIQHLILDRFSALARWGSNLGKKKIKPYYRNSHFSFFTYFLFDLQHLCIYLILFNNLLNIQYLIETYLIISFLASVTSILLYIFLSKKYLKNISNQNDNKK